MKIRASILEVLILGRFFTSIEDYLTKNRKDYPDYLDELFDGHFQGGGALFRRRPGPGEAAGGAKVAGSAVLGNGRVKTVRLSLPLTYSHSSSGNIRPKSPTTNPEKTEPSTSRVS